MATAIAVAAIRWLGFVPAELAHAPSAGVQRLAGQLDVDVEDLAAYDPPERTAREHRQRAAQLARFRDPDPRDVDDVEDLLVEHALEHDSPLALLRTAALALRDRQLLRPGISTLERLVASARARAESNTHERLEPVLDAQTRRALDALCVTDVRLGISRLVWLGREARSASPAQIVAQLDKLAFLRELGAPDWQLEAVSANRRRQLVALARRSTTAALAGRPDRLRYPALLCFCHDQAVRLLDEILDRADQALGEAHGQALRELRDLKAQTATAANEKVALFDPLVGLLLDDSVADDEVRARVGGDGAGALGGGARAGARDPPTGRARRLARDDVAQDAPDPRRTPSRPEHQTPAGRQPSCHLSRTRPPASRPHSALIGERPKLGFSGRILGANGDPAPRGARAGPTMRLGTASGGEADYRDAYPSAMAVITDNLDALVAHLRWPSEHRKRIRSTDENVKGVRAPRGLVFGRPIGRGGGAQGLRSPLWRLVAASGDGLRRFSGSRGCRRAATRSGRLAVSGR